ncbi:2-dehydro-3-deoxy-6-phosphogalactonate aldolase [Vibrio vulnificus]|uniref:2-dehydro-3-deoxy-6-phosphogalactonate aldolase n=1 Tax=Vibrio vulnificus TaxID=672 RepID=UPI001022C4E9|nr:2-dehydro-3-deoxy-6-phosphogalactonate aldolase [Vibrio vulnificus]EGQ7953847.1 2-dehydro-3-deoxy-6-phosphogalactonate aldolase [Vibrio vulnificus]EGQ7988884.1 2-dehydro-3-deoxy-6-phosphogalactonate aldolase [Vibrio vulnificus]EGQ8174251.1 2-dehydro-3-deoxy-6-phosphogalactonate aldolase [Vibrio vulnificus]EGQ9235791.1 2-dehydro-3-deoxy-6-phosphogalactonate aldolase [Vibrio vulnificus]EGR0087575.1 2-dehydro-3-deoxy-6-phosphogalactonate aldolase [Vibrio vulnificus]
MNSIELRNNPWFKNNPLIAILRGVESNEIVELARKLIEHEFRLIEIPLNSPNALKSIELLVNEFGNEAIIGAGTVTDEEKLDAVLAVGAKLIVTPNMNPQVVRKAVEHQCLVCCGVATPTEAFDAITNGASVLKLFPAEVIKPTGLKAIKSVLPPEVMCLPVGGINPDPALMREYLDVGAEGFGLGSNLYKRGISLAEVESNAIAYRNAWNQL